MRNPLRLSSHTTEMYSAFLRWFFLIALVLLVYFPQFNVILTNNIHQFNILVIFAFLYMGVTQIVLRFWDEHSKAYKILTKAGVIFDGLAFFWLLALTGAANSPLFPIAYLVCIHAAIYWRLIGAVVSSIILFAGYSLLLVEQGFSFENGNLFKYLVNICFLFLIALYGGVIASRERAMLKQKNIYQTQAIEDYLTGVYNHRHFQENLKGLVKSKAPFYLIMTDIDHFKKINDDYGHVTGDMVLKEIAGTLEDKLPHHKGQVFRYGGEEFAVLLPELSPDMVERYIGAVTVRLQETKFESEEGDFTVTLSFGVAKFEAGLNPNDVVRKADRRLYLAKRRGRNQAVFAGE